MTTRNERKIRAGYDLFLAADPDVDEDWTPDAPVAALMADTIEWFDDVNEPGGRAEPSFRNKGDGAAREPDDRHVLGRLRDLRREMPYCQIMSCIEDESKKVVHTVDHALKSDDKGERPQLCASSFEFDDAGKVKAVRYCSRELHLNSPSPQESAS